MIDTFDDIYELPLFTDEHRKLRAELQSANLSFPQPEDNGEAALVASVAMLGTAGFLDIACPASGRMSITDLSLAREVLATRSVIGDLALVMQALGSLPLQLAEPQRFQALLTQVRTGSAITAFALSEPDAGSDVAALTTSARIEGDVYVLNGVKHLISNAGVATHYSVFARTSEGGGGISAFLLPAHTAGLSTRQTPPMMAHPLGTVVLENVRVPISHRIGAEGDGLKLALATLARCRTSVGAAACGFARRAIEEAIRHVTRRKAFGATLAKQQLVQSLLSHCIAELDAARLLVYRASRQFDLEPDRRHDRAVSEAKWFATEAAQRIIDRCLQMAGGTGTLDGSIFSRLYRAIRPLRIYEGASEIHQLVIAREVLEQEESTPRADC